MTKILATYVVPENVDFINDHLFNDKGELIPPITAYLMSLTRNQRQWFMHTNGLYSLPTQELLGKLEEIIGDTPRDKVLEIGGGNGVYGRNLGIRSTDNYMQHPKNRNKFLGVQESYSSRNIPLVQYGNDVEELDALKAVKKYNPEIVLCAWVTHKWDSRHQERGGNMYGVDFKKILAHPSVKKVILVGNHSIHGANPIMELPHAEIDYKGYIFSRSGYPQLDRIYIWNTEQLKKKKRITISVKPHTIKLKNKA